MALTGIPTLERENFFQFLLNEKAILSEQAVLSENFATKKELISQLSETKAQIEELSRKQNDLECRIQHYTEDRDRKFILKHWQKLLDLYKKHHPKIFEKIVVSCFEFYRLESKWGKNNGKISVRLSDLLEKWSSGCSYKGMPVLSVHRLYSYYQGTSETLLIYITPHGKLKTVYRDDIKKYIEFLRYWPECPAWSEIAVSDFKFDSRHSIIKKQQV